MSYLIFKSLHLIAIICWMAALLYLPRLFAYHSRNNTTKETSEIFKIMEQKLAKIIMNPSMVASVIFGLALIHFGGGLSQIWLHVKLTLILVMIAYHFFLLKCLKKFAEDKNNYEEKFFRIINEVPAILMIIIVFLVVLKPF